MGHPLIEGYSLSIYNGTYAWLSVLDDNSLFQWYKAYMCANHYWCPGCEVYTCVLCECIGALCASLEETEDWSVYAESYML